MGTERHTPAQHEPSAISRSVVVHYGEIGLKGKNQPQFRRQLRRVIREKLSSLGFDWWVEEAAGMLMVRADPEASSDDLERVVGGLQQVFGIAWMTIAEGTPHGGFGAETGERDFALLEERLLDLGRRRFETGKTFAVRVRRGEKRVPFTSPQLERRLGALLLSETDWEEVSLANPDMVFYLDVRHDQVLLYTRKEKGPGGLPVGTAGRVLALLSGGIDSPVAAYFMGRRGCRVDFIHFAVDAFDMGQGARDKICRLARRLSCFTVNSRLHIVPYVHFDLALLREKVEFELVLFRRFMLRVAEVLAGRTGSQALITGDNLSQVASQTLSNLVSTTRGILMPVFRPLIGFEKEEIMDWARRIGTFDISIEPYKDCCALIGRHPRTSSDHEAMAAWEARLFPDYEQLIERTLADAVVVKLEHGTMREHEALGARRP
jgi:tRNA uracil 4-sulfurtransferase